MNVKITLLLISILLYSVTPAHAQKQAPLSDSLWCDYLNEIIKCVSTAEISDRVAKGITDSTYIPGMTPELRLTDLENELIMKEYGKVSYVSYLYTVHSRDSTLDKQFTWWYQKIKDCLQLWDEARLKNANPYAPNAPDDYFFTNTEDETSVRLDIVRDNGYNVRLRIY